VIDPARLDSPFDEARNLFAKNEVLRSDRFRRPEEQRAESQHIEKYTDDCARRVTHVRILPESLNVCSRLSPRKPVCEVFAYHILQTTTDLDEYLIEMPGVAEFPTPSADAFGVLSAESLTPRPNRLVGHGDAALGHHFSTSRQLTENRKYNHTQWLMTSGGKR
jgi:hypothetical protein